MNHQSGKGTGSLSPPLSAGQVSNLDKDAFVQLLADVYEHSSWVAEIAWQLRPFVDRQQLADAMERAMREATYDRQLLLIRAHPKLTGRVADNPTISANSSLEQKGAGLDRCTPHEYERLMTLNAAYEARFNFPFIIAVKGQNRYEILKAIEKRLANTQDTEFTEALDQIVRIASHRLDSLIT